MFGTVTGPPSCSGADGGIGIGVARDWGWISSRTTAVGGCGGSVGFSIGGGSVGVVGVSTCAAIASVGVSTATGDGASTVVNEGWGAEVGASNEAALAVAETADLEGKGATLLAAFWPGDNKVALPAPRTSSATRAIAR